MKRFLLALAALALAEPVMAQSPLADAARREAARRKQAGAAQVQVVTNDDVMKLPTRAATPGVPKPAATAVTIGAAGGAITPAGQGQAAAGAPAAAAQPGATGQAPPPTTGPQAEQYWRSRIATARENLQRLEMQADAFESRINALTADFVNRDDPAQRQQIFEARQKALAEFDRVKAEIALATKAISDIEDEARRLNVPPGWLR